MFLGVQRTIMVCLILGIYIFDVTFQIKIIEYFPLSDGVISRYREQPLLQYCTVNLLKVVYGDLEGS